MNQVHQLQQQLQSEPHYQQFSQLQQQWSAQQASNHANAARPGNGLQQQPQQQQHQPQQDSPQQWDPMLNQWLPSQVMSPASGGSVNSLRGGGVDDSNTDSFPSSNNNNNNQINPATTTKSNNGCVITTLTANTANMALNSLKSGSSSETDGDAGLDRRRMRYNPEALPAPIATSSALNPGGDRYILPSSTSGNGRSHPSSSTNSTSPAPMLMRSPDNSFDESRTNPKMQRRSVESPRSSGNGSGGTVSGAPSEFAFAAPTAGKQNRSIMPRSKLTKEGSMDNAPWVEGIYMYNISKTHRKKSNKHTLHITFLFFFCLYVQILLGCFMLSLSLHQLLSVDIQLIYIYNINMLL
jgi:hypothetical protein